MQRTFLLYCLVTISVTIIFPSILFSQDMFIIGAEDVSGRWEFAHGSPPHSSDFWDTVKSFGLNYAGLKYFQRYGPDIGYIDSSDILAELDSAESRDIKVFLYNGFDIDRGDVVINPLRWVYQLEETDNPATVDFLNIIDAPNDFDDDALTHWDLADPIVQNPNFIHLEPGVDPYGLLASNLREKNLQPDGPDYYVKIRMRLPDATTYQHVAVCTVKVYYDNRHQMEGYVYADDFSDHNWKEIEVLCFIKTSSGPIECEEERGSEIYDYPDSSGQNQVPNCVLKEGVTSANYDYRIYWNETNPHYTLDIDYIAIDNKNARRLFAGDFNDRIDDAVDNYATHNAVLNFQAHDEVANQDLFPVRQINQRMQLSTNKDPLCYHYFSRNPDNPPTPVTKRFLWETDMQVLMSDVYPISKDTKIPGESGYTDTIQCIFQDHLITLNYRGIDGGLKHLIDASKQFNKPFWFTVQGHKWDRPPEQAWLREPSAFEIKAMTNLAVCYGAKGIIYYLYSSPHNDITIHGFFQKDIFLPRYTDEYGYPKWNTVKQLNQKLASIGDDLLSLTWEGAKSWHNGSTAGTWTEYITSVTTNVSGEDKYVEIGQFTNASSVDYFFVVNRRTSESESRDITLTFNKSSSYSNWKVTEVGTDNSWIVSKKGNFQTDYEPGEGKLFKFEPIFVGSSETINGNITVTQSLTVPSGKTLTIGAGCNLTFNNNVSLIFNGTLNAVGTSNNLITFTSMSGTTQSSWGSIVFSGSGASGSTLEYANIKYGTRVEANNNASNIIIQYCNIDTTYDGVYFNGATGSILNNIITTNSIGAGIRIEGGSGATCNDNIVTKTGGSRTGTGILCGGGSGGYVARNDIYHWSWGIGAIWNGSPISYSETVQCNNRIKKCYSGVVVYRNSDFIFGAVYSSHYGNNSLDSNTINVSVGMYYTSYPCTLLAHNNWWGDYPPNTSLFLIGPNADFSYDYPLQTDPCSGMGKMVAGNNGSSSGVDDVSESPANNIESLISGIELRREKKYSEAKDFFISYIADHPENQAAYVELYNCYSKETASDLINYFSSLPKEASKDHKLLLSYLYLKNGNVKEAKEVNNIIIEENSNTELATRAKLNNVYIALYNEGNIKEAVTIFNEVMNKAELSTPLELNLVYQDIEIYGNTYGTEIKDLSAPPKLDSFGKDLPKQEASSEKEIPDKYCLLGNYPNPFNPSTAISYALPFQSSVELVIYDIIGRVVKSFNISSQSAGYQSIVWNGRNEMGNSVVSGVYLYRISIKSLENNQKFVKTAKLMLMK